MHHAEAQERLSELALEPGRLARLEDDRSPGAGALREHIAGCDRCAADLAGWRQAWSAMGLDARTDDVEREVLHAPARLRAATLAAIAAEGAVRVPATGTADVTTSEARPTARGPRARRLVLPAPWLAVAAAVVIAVAAGGVAWVRSSELDGVRAQNVELAAAASMLDRVLAAPVHWVTPLRAPGGSASGTLAWTDTEIVVLASGLAQPASGQTYRCWVEHDGVRTPVGSMSFSGPTGSWAGSMGSWAGAFAPGATFGVSLVSNGSGEAPTVLLGSL